MKKEYTYFSTEDYDLFKSLDGNRPIVQNKIDKIVEDIQSGFDYLQYCPIIVNSEFYIIDGQHRFEVSKILKREVYYVIREEAHTKSIDIARLNSRGSKWTDKDFIQCYIKAGLKDYEDIKEYNDKGIVISDSIRLLTHGNPSGFSIDKEAFKSGKFVSKNKEKSDAFLKKIDMFDYKKKYKRHFLFSIWKIIQKNVVEWDRLVSSVNRDCHDYEGSSYKEIATQIEMSYNFRLRERVQIF